MSKKKVPPAYTSKLCKEFRMGEKWPNGIPAVYDCAGNLVCICPEDHGYMYADGIASALNARSGKLLEKAK
jgi:hypothetical protein